MVNGAERPECAFQGERVSELLRLCGARACGPRTPGRGETRRVRPVRDRRRRRQVEPVGHHGKVLSRHDELLGVGAEVLVEVGHQAGDPRADGQVGVVASLLADPSVWLDSVLADRVGAALRWLPAGTVRAARLVSRTQRGYQVTRVTVDMSVTAPDMLQLRGPPWPP
jgi:hypothetical protein